MSSWGTGAERLEPWLMARSDVLFAVAAEMSTRQTGIRQSPGRDSGPRDWMRSPGEEVETEKSAG